MKNSNIHYKLWLFLLFVCIDHSVFAQQTPLSQNGQLKVCGTKLCNQYGNPIQLRGMSTHGIQWYGWQNCLTETSLDVLAYDWGADILRISLYVQEGGYESDPIGFTNQVGRLIEEATQRGMYALVDWHQLSPGDPNANLENAERFFTDIATKYKSYTNVIYDVCNEPNGSGVNWNRIKSYADQIIPVIQNIDKDAVVLVGTQGWATFGVSGEGSLQDVLDNPLTFENVMYTFHFYATSHRESYLSVLDAASDKLPVFVTEFGSQEYTGDGPNDFAMTQRFIDLMQQKQISWTSWNYSDDFRSGAAWKTGTCSGGPWTVNQLKEAGKWIREKIQFPEDDFPGGTVEETQSPYLGTPAQIPGIIEAENYDKGGKSIAFEDTTLENQGEAYRTDAVDIETCEEGGYNVGWVKTGEWLEYSIDVNETQTYVMNARVAAIASGKKFHLEINGQDVSGSIEIPNTGGWQQWQTVSTEFSLNKGLKIIRIVMDSDDFNINHLTFEKKTTDTNEVPSISWITPENGSTFTVGTSITLSAAAQDNDGNIKKVSFFDDDTLLAEVFSEPFIYTWSDAPVGIHNLTALTEDDKGAQITSTVVSIDIKNTNGGGQDCNETLYIDGFTYDTGDIVQNEGKKYECTVGGWCSVGGPYEPGVGWAWQNAWKELGLCSGTTNQSPEVISLTPSIIYTDQLPAKLPINVKATDPDGTIAQVVLEAESGNVTLTEQGEDVFQSDITIDNYGTFTFPISAIDNEGASTNFSIQVTVKNNTSGGDFILTKQEYEDLFPYRYGVDLTTLEIDPAKDFFTYEAFVNAVNLMKTIEITFDRRKGTNLYRLTRLDKSINESKIIRTDQDFDADWNLSKPIITKIVDYGKFVNENNPTVIKRELAAFLANISQETTGGWATAPGGPYSWGLHFREEQGYEGTDNLGYREEGNQSYPPASGKSYHGRGPIQLSWNYNYGQVSEFLFGDKNILLTNPEQVLQDAALAFQTAIWFWMTPQYPKPSAHDVMVGNWSPSAYDLERNRKPGFGMTVNIINGGLECGKGNEIPKVLSRIGFYERYTGILNVNNDLDTSDDCSECGCAMMQSYFGVEPEPTRLGKENLSINLLDQLHISPNPFKDEMIIKASFLKGEQLIFKVTDIQGNVLFSSAFNSGKDIRLTEFSKLPVGLYFAQVKLGNSIKTFKMVKN